MGRSPGTVATKTCQLVCCLPAALVAVQDRGHSSLLSASSMHNSTYHNNTVTIVVSIALIAYDIHKFPLKKKKLLFQLLCRSTCFEFQNPDLLHTKSNVLNHGPKFRSRWASFLFASLRQHHSIARMILRWCLRGALACSLSPHVFAGNAWNIMCLCLGSAGPRHFGSIPVAVSITSDSMDFSLISAISLKRTWKSKKSCYTFLNTCCCNSITHTEISFLQ